MSEGTHSPATIPQDAPSPELNYTYPGYVPPPENAGRKRRMILIATGSITALLIGGLLFQIFRPETGAAGPDAGTNANTNARSDVFATVNGQPVTKQEVAEECLIRHGREVLDSLINRTVIQQACATRGVAVSKTEVANEIRRIAAKFKMSPEQWYQMLAAERGISPEHYQRDIIWPMLALRKIAGTDVKVSDDEMRKAFIREYGIRVKAKMIMLDNQRRAMDVLDKVLKRSDDFERLARDESIERNSAALGGDIPPVRRYGGNDKLEDAAFKLRTGEISPLIQVAVNRWVILKCEGRTKPLVENIETVRHELYEQLKEEKMQTAVAKVFDRLKRETKIVNHITGQQTGIQQTSGSQPVGKARIGDPYPTNRRIR